MTESLISKEVIKAASIHTGSSPEAISTLRGMFWFRGICLFI